MTGGSHRPIPRNAATRYIRQPATSLARRVSRRAEGTLPWTHLALTSGETQWPALLPYGISRRPSSFQESEDAAAHDGSRQAIDEEPPIRVPEKETRKIARLALQQIHRHQRLLHIREVYFCEHDCRLLEPGYGKIPLVR